MPNYRYHSQDGTRRRGCGQMPAALEAVYQVSRDTRNICNELSSMPVAMAYVPWQEWRNIYEAEKGFHRGTIFEELDKPFCGIGGLQNVR